MYLDSNIIVARWPVTAHVIHNWGDKLNRELIWQLARQPVSNVSDIHGWEDRPVYRVIGSGLGSLRDGEIVWGMGFIKHGAELAAKPARLCAVRGPLSGRRLEELGIACPDIYGDPAILFPLFFYPEVEKTHDVGLIQHVREVGRIEPARLPHGISVKVIDICGTIHQVVRDITACRRIVSSSLHGLICAHAYGVEANWLKASSYPLGDGFKFEDYYASIGVDDVPLTRVDEYGVFDTANQPSTPGHLRIDPERLLHACPFISVSRKRELVRALGRAINAGRRGLIFQA